VAFELWETSSGNIVDDFETETQALEAVRDALRMHGVSYVSTWLLAYEDEMGETDPIASGLGLIELARRTPA
jgi:hypothetical protein